MINCCFEVWISETALISAGSLVTLLAVLKSSVVLHTELWPTQLTNIQHFARFFCRGMWGGTDDEFSELLSEILFIYKECTAMSHFLARRGSKWEGELCSSPSLLLQPGCLPRRSCPLAFSQGHTPLLLPLSAGSCVVFPVPDMHTGKHSCNQSVLLLQHSQAVPRKVSLTFPKFVIAHMS